MPRVQEPTHELLHDADAVCGRRTDRVLRVREVRVHVLYEHMTLRRGVCGHGGARWRCTCSVSSGSHLRRASRNWRVGKAYECDVLAPTYLCGGGVAFSASTAVGVVPRGHLRRDGICIGIGHAARHLARNVLASWFHHYQTTLAGSALAPPSRVRPVTRQHRRRVTCRHASRSPVACGVTPMARYRLGKRCMPNGDSMTRHGIHIVAVAPRSCPSDRTPLHACHHCPSVQVRHGP